MKFTILLALAALAAATPNPEANAEAAPAPEAGVADGTVQLDERNNHGGGRQCYYGTSCGGNWNANSCKNYCWKWKYGYYLQSCPQKGWYKCCCSH